MKKFITFTSLINLYILFLISTSNNHISASYQPYKTLVAPINKDIKTSLYTITLNTNQQYVIELESSFSWNHCPRKTRPAVACFTSECFQATYLPIPATSCSLPTSSETPCICQVTPVNPITNTCASSKLYSQNVTLSWTNGAKPTSIATFNDTFLSCAPKSLLHNFPKGVIGMASLSRAPLALSSQFSTQNIGVSRKFALCLPSTTSRNGVVFFGDGPYNLMPPTNFDVSSLLSYTPLLINPKAADYGIGIKALSIGGASVSNSMSPFEGIGISVTISYTRLRTDFYKQFVRMFTKAMKGIPRVKKVAPFSICYKTSSIGFNRVGLRVPQIDLQFDNGKNWTIYGGNSMKQVGKDTACLAFLDGGEMHGLRMEIGSFQMEDNLLVFDIDNSRLGFSSYLLFDRISCGSFSF